MSALSDGELEVMRQKALLLGAERHRLEVERDQLAGDVAVLSRALKDIYGIAHGRAGTWVDVRIICESPKVKGALSE